MDPSQLGIRARDLRRASGAWSLLPAQANDRPAHPLITFATTTHSKQAERWDLWGTATIIYRQRTAPRFAHLRVFLGRDHCTRKNASTPNAHLIRVHASEPECVSTHAGY